MAELLLVRHAQASFGAEDYDALSELGHAQARLLGELLRERGWEPDRVVTGALRRQGETAASMGLAVDEVEPGFDEYDFHDLLTQRFEGDVPHDVRTDRRTHFRTLRETLAMWQRGEIAGAGESWEAFRARVARGLAAATRPGARRVLVVSSGGPVGRIVAETLGAPDAAMIPLNLQVKNTSMTRIVFNERVRYLVTFNETPHLDAPERADMLTWS